MVAYWGFRPKGKRSEVEKISFDFKDLEHPIGLLGETIAWPALLGWPSQ
jgi:hypothetical protein